MGGEYMFESYNMDNFGNYMKNIRKQLKYSQEKVATTTKLSTETLRKIENGYVVPRYDTLERLTRLYKTDLHSAFGYFRSSQALFTLYKKIDELILNYQFQEIQIIEKLLSEVTTNNESEALVENKDILQLTQMIYGITNFYNSKFENAHENFITAFEISSFQFNINTFMNSNYTIIESRILLMISMCEAELGFIEQSNTILNFTLNLISNNDLSSEDGINLILKIYFNLAYNYHTLNKLDNVIHISTEAVEYCNAHNSSYLMHVFFYRRGIAKYMLKKDDYLDDLKKCVSILQITEKKSLLTIYRKITLKKYNITI